MYFYILYTTAEGVDSSSRAFDNLTDAELFAADRKAEGCYAISCRRRNAPCY